MTLPEATIDALVSQYRGELSATMAYARALEKFAGQVEEPTLRLLQEEHGRAAGLLAAAIRRHGGVVPEGAGAWGAFAAAIERLAALINDEVPLQALHHGEVIGRQGYAALIADPALPRSLAAELRALDGRADVHEAALAALIRDLPTAPTRRLL